jgi:hypothetical protein
MDAERTEPSSTRRSKASHILSAVLVTAVLGPVTLVAGAAAGWAGVQQFLSGWIPADWIIVPTDGSSPVDVLFGTTKGSGGRYVTFLAGALVATGGATAIRRVWRR